MGVAPLDQDTVQGPELGGAVEVQAVPADHRAVLPVGDRHIGPGDQLSDVSVVASRVRVEFGLRVHKAHAAKQLHLVAVLVYDRGIGENARAVSAAVVDTPGCAVDVVQGVEASAMRVPPHSFQLAVGLRHRCQGG